MGAAATCPSAEGEGPPGQVNPKLVEKHPLRVQFSEQELAELFPNFSGLAGRNGEYYPKTGKQTIRESLEDGGVSPDTGSGWRGQDHSVVRFLSLRLPIFLFAFIWENCGNSWVPREEI